MLNQIQDVLLLLEHFFVKDIPFKNNDHRYLPLIAFHRGAKSL